MQAIPNTITGSTKSEILRSSLANPFAWPGGYTIATNEHQTMNQPIDLLDGLGEPIGLTISPEDARSVLVDGIPIVVIHHSDDNCFTAHRLDTGDHIGWGIDKHEAKIAGIMNIRYSD